VNPSSANNHADHWNQPFLKSHLTQENDRSTLNDMNAPLIETREKILATAEQLIYQNGIHATGMDLLVKTSGVARKSIYRYFATKDEVAAAALNARDVRWMAWFRTESDKAETADARILNMFVVLKGWFESEGFHGCAFINTAGEIGDPNDPIRLIAKLHKQKLFDYTLELCEQLNIEQPSALAKQLLILMEGAITMARVMGDFSAADSAKDVAQLLLKQASP
jgi:AcrR family transcriptional regulator